MTYGELIGRAKFNARPNSNLAQTGSLYCTKEQKQHVFTLRSEYYPSELKAQSHRTLMTEVTAGFDTCPDWAPFL